jgi:rRNA maturation endonuclease Nob1
VTETYKLDCYVCGRTITVPPSDGERNCPLCGAVLKIAWGAGQTESEKRGQEPGGPAE